MSENKQKLIALVSALEEENIIDYFYTSIGLKVYGKAKLPDSITEELRQLSENGILPYKDGQEDKKLMPDEYEAMRHRCEITKAVYDIKSIAILNYINIIVRDVYEEAQEQGATISAYQEGMQIDGKKTTTD